MGQERAGGAAEAAHRVASRSMAPRPLPVHGASRSSHRGGNRLGAGSCIQAGRRRGSHERAEIRG